MYERLFVVCLFCIVVNTIAAFEISSKIDFESDDVTIGDSSSDEPDPVIIVVENSNNDDHEEIVRGFGSTRLRARGYVTVRGPVKTIISQRNYQLNSHQPRPKVTKNVRIIVNGAGTTKPENFNCREGVCETTVATQTDEMGNVVGSVRLTIVSKTKDTKVEDVPVIDGIRGTGYDNRNPTFGFDDRRENNRPTFYDNNIPQAPANRKDRIPWRNPSRPQSTSFNSRNSGSRHQPPVWMPRIPTGISVDDKIEAPLSQTNPQ